MAGFLQVRKEYGVKKDLLGLLDGRETFVIDKDGTILLAYNNQASHLLLPCLSSMCCVCIAGSMHFTSLLLYHRCLHMHHCISGQCNCCPDVRCVPSFVLFAELYAPR